MMTIERTKQFKKDLKTIQTRKYDLALIEEVVELLAEGNPLPEKYQDHALIGNWVGHRECHILPNWLLVYTYRDNRLVLVLTRTGTHSDLFI